MRLGKKIEEKKEEVKKTGPEISVRKTWTLDRFTITKEGETIRIRDTSVNEIAYVINAISVPDRLAAPLADILLQASP